MHEQKLSVSSWFGFVTVVVVASAGCGESVALSLPDMSGGVDLAGCASQCAGKCVDLMTDRNNCGLCNVACTGTEVCVGGKCAAPGCMAAAECADMHKCTIDTCEAGVCKHVAGPNSGATGCPAGTLCDAAKGCVPVTQPPPGALCNMTPPTGATLAAAPPKYSGGTCPTLKAGANTITSSGASRSFLLAVPADIANIKQKLPVVFLWHWLGGSANSFYTKGQIQTAVDTQHFLAVIPEAKGDLQFKWPFNVADSQSRMDEELRFFEDMYACVAEQFAVNKECVASAGVSAGALFTDQLAAARSQYLASGLSLSGGVGDLIRGWAKPSHKLPMLVLWGGPADTCFNLMNFDKASKNLESALETEGNFFLECIHNCGHAEPPLDAPMGLSKYGALWQFVFDHPFWLKAGESPYIKNGIPADFPSWCGIGRASATPRTGACPDPPGC